MFVIESLRGAPRIGLGLVLGLFVAACGAAADKPTAADIDKAMHATWDKQKTSLQERQAVTINSIKMGQTNPANDQDVVDGVPPKAAVTAALIDFTVRSFYPRETRAVRRVREAKVYKDKFGEWAVMTGQSRGQDATTSEPAQ